MNLIDVITIIGSSLIGLTILSFFGIMIIQSIFKKADFETSLHKTIPMIGILGVYYLLIAGLLFVIMEVLGNPITRFWLWLPSTLKDIIILIGYFLILISSGLIINFLNKRKKY